jgi:hypothetical protein
MPKKRKLNSKNPKYWPEKPASEKEKVVRKLLCEIPGKAKVYGVYKD